MTSPTAPARHSDPWRDVVDQAAAIRQLEAAAQAPVHAYLLVGPPGSGKRALARGFAAQVLATPDASDDDRERHVRLALAEQHPDLRI
ncbi:MAG TPA: ATP-binding protein, partial [Acidimicrobiales bacterium]